MLMSEISEGFFEARRFLEYQGFNRDENQKAWINR